MRSRTFIYALGVGFVVAAQSGLAQPSTTDEKVEELVVTGTRLPTALKDVGTSVEVLTREDFDRLNVRFLSDALITLPGVTVNQNGSFGGVSTVRIRGSLSEQTLVLIDGVEVNDTTSPGGGFDFARLDPDQIERVEVLKGPQSTLWGSDAIGGVISITTRRADQGLGASGFAEFGSYNTVRGGAAVEYGGDRGDLRVGATGLTTDGISAADTADGNSEDDGLDNILLSASGGLNLPADARLSFSLLYNDADNEFDSFGFETGVADGDEESKTEEFTGNIRLDLPLFDGKLDNLFLAGYSDIERDNFADGIAAFSARGEREIYRYQGTVTPLNVVRLAFGAEREENRSNGDDQSIDSYFALLELKPLYDITINGGVRHDDHSVFGGETTFRVAGAWQPVPSLNVSATWGEGFKAPSLFQTTFFCCGATAANADLRPETSEAYDLAVDYSLFDGRGSVGVAYFNQDTVDLITFSFIDGGFINIEEVNTEGVELSGRYDLASWLQMGGNYSYIRARDGDGLRLNRVPRHTAAVTLTYQPIERLSTTALLQYNGTERDSFGDAADWVRVDLSFQYDLSERWELYGRVENLFDEQYQQVFGFGTPGISANLGFRVRI